MKQCPLTCLLIIGLLLSFGALRHFGDALAPGNALADKGTRWKYEDDRDDDEDDGDDRDSLAHRDELEENDQDRDDDEDEGDDHEGWVQSDGTGRLGQPGSVTPRTWSNAPSVATPAGRGLAITRGPYLQLSTPDAITIRWQTSQPTASLVRYGSSADKLELRRLESSPTTDHEVRLDRLSPDTRYFYSVGTGTSVLAGGRSCSFRTPPPVGTRQVVRIWMIGDSGLRGRAQQRVLQAFESYSRGAPTDAWLLLGDNAYTVGTSQQYQVGFFEPYASRLRSTVVWPSRGNHDEIRAGPGNDYYDFFTLPTAAEAGGVPSGTEAYYSFDFAQVHFVCLDAERLDAGMIEWLRADLGATEQDWVIAYWHHPPYSKGSHDSDRDGVMSVARSRLLPVLERGGADLIACGHSHSYERSFLIDGHYGHSGTLTPAMILDRGDGDPNGDGPYRKPTSGRPAPNEGAVYVVVGSSSKLSEGSLHHRVHAKSLRALGSLAVEISENRLDAAFVDDRGRVADRFAIVKGGDPLSQDGSRSNRGTSVPGTRAEREARR